LWKIGRDESAVGILPAEPLAGRTAGKMPAARWRLPENCRQDAGSTLNEN
jgi:hypothetical protein